MKKKIILKPWVKATLLLLPEMLIMVHYQEKLKQQ